MGDNPANKSQYVLPQDQPFVRLEIETAFNGLTDKEKTYAHYISQASWAGGLITFLQTSKESGPLFVLLHQLFSSQSNSEFVSCAIEAGFSEEDVKALFVYGAGVFANAGNYKGFGDTKIVPNIEQSRFEELLKISVAWPKLEELWILIKDDIYDLSPGKTCLGFHPVGTSTYISKNVTQKDEIIVQEFLKERNMECYNTRLFKTEEENQVVYETRLASERSVDTQIFDQDGARFTITGGDYSPILELVTKYLSKAVEYAANETQENMLKAYEASFRYGSLNDHKKGSRFWIKDKSPTVETYIGFIETYRDPAGVRGEFEGFVAAVNKEMSKKFTALVSNAERLLELLPWGKEFEKDKFLKPDFTSLDVLTFAGSGIPAGINIPNYDDIRQTEGFKNVSLGNVIPASYQQTVTPFLSLEDAELLQKWRIPAFEVQVGLHELLGHGSGKLLKSDVAGLTFNFPDSLLDPFTGKFPEPLYGPTDTYDNRFGPLSSSYEECRAEAVGLYLSLEPEVLKIFGHEGEEAEEITYVNWLSLVWSGAGRGLELWEPGRGWLQAHAQARYVISQVLIEAGVVTVTQPTENDLLVTLDRSAIKTKGRAAIGDFLVKLQVYKSTGNVSEAEKLYEHYSAVLPPWTTWRAIVLANKQPRKIFVQANTFLDGDEVRLKQYEPTMEGMIESWVERFLEREQIYKDIMELYHLDAHHF